MNPTVPSDRQPIPAAPGPLADAEGATPRALKAVLIVLARYETRSLRRWFDDFDRDILLAILLGEIALHNIGALQNGVARRGSTRTPPTAEAQAADSDEDHCGLKPCNAYSIAAATGLPRETVRRKVARLIELGWIRREDNGHLFVTDDALERFGAVLRSRALAELLETADHVRRLLGEARS